MMSFGARLSRGRVGRLAAGCGSPPQIHPNKPNITFRGANVDSRRRAHLCARGEDCGPQTTPTKTTRTSGHRLPNTISSSPSTGSIVTNFRRSRIALEYVARARSTGPRGRIPVSSWSVREQRNSGTGPTAGTRPVLRPDETKVFLYLHLHLMQSPSHDARSTLRVA